jgi:ATP-dependent exoDNAse (exonuclease V) alpha subunit
MTAEITYEEFQENLSKLNEQQQTALDLILSGENVYITGVGGTGKSFLITTLIESLKEDLKTAVVASSTGISALSIGGCTIHSLLGTGVKGTIEEIEALVLTAKARKKFKDNLKEVDVIIIDEVSMLSGPYIDMIDYYLKSMRRNNKPFGGFQMIFSGDFLQLPPVFKDKFGNDSKPIYAFESDAWNEANIQPVELIQSFRQSENDLFDMLCRVRLGDCGEDVRLFFDQCVGRQLDNPTKLFPTNQESFQYNMRKLNKVEGNELSYDATVFGEDQYKIDALKKNCIAEEELIIKIGAPVIILTNNKHEGYVNGSRGILKSIDKEGAYVQLLDGSVVYVKKYTWDSIGPKLDENGEPEVLASMTQYPIKLAYSITMHKSQGMSLDYLSVDLSKCFASGQAYVALSRCRTLEGLSIDQRMNQKQVFVDPKLVKFHDSLKK